MPGSPWPRFVAGIGSPPRAGRALGQRVGRELAFLGCHLAALRREYGQSIEEQAAAFGLDPEALTKLALCRMPASVEDVEKIAARMGMGLGVLLLPLTLATWNLARNDLARMGKGAMDPSGEFLTRSSRDACNVALAITVAHTLFLLLCLLCR